MALERLEDRTLLSNSGPATTSLQTAYGQLPLAFEANQGQSPAAINFVARGAGYALSLMPTEAVLGLQKPASTSGAEANASPGDVVQLQLVGANPAAPVVGLDELTTKSNYFFGSDSNQWRTNVANFGKVEYQNAYPGINLVYYGNQGELEYDFVVTPGANPGTITLSAQGSQGMALDGQGNLVMHMGGGDVVEQAPVLYQESRGVHQAVSGRFVLEGNNQVGFQVGTYDPSRALVIDPVFSYSTYLGGNGDDFAGSIAVDNSGNAYVTGVTYSTNFPTANALQTSLQGSVAAFVTKLNASGTALVYSTYLGGSLTPTGVSASNAGLGIAVDSAGNAYMTGVTRASNFPTTQGAVQTLYGGGSQNAFVVKLSASGGLVYSTYLGGSGTDGFTNVYGVSTHSANPIAVDGAGNAYVAGPTTSANFPTTTGTAYPTWNSSWGSAGFITEINATGSALVYSTYLPGGPGHGLAFHAGEIYVTGGTTSASLPTTSGAFQKSLSAPGDTDAFVAVLNPTLAPVAQIIYATYLGGNLGSKNHGGSAPSNFGFGIAVDGSGNAFVSGSTGATNFPTTAGAFQTKFIGGAYVLDAFVVKINPDASGSTSLIYSTYLGGSTNGGSNGNGIAVDAADNAYVVGDTYPPGFPITSNAIQSKAGQSGDIAFVTTFNASGSGLLFSTFLGSTSQHTAGEGIALDGSGNIYVTGFVNFLEPANFPTTPGAFQTVFGGGIDDAFIAKISAVVGGAASPPPGSGGQLTLKLVFNALALASFGVSIKPLQASAGKSAEQGMVLARALVSSQPIVPLARGVFADRMSLVRVLPLSQQSWLDRVFADFDARQLQELFLGDNAFA